MAESQDKTAETPVSSVAATPENYVEKEVNKTEFAEETSQNSSLPFAPPPDVVDLCKEAFQKTAEYLRGELDGTIEDYKLLEKMNQLTMNKYSEMKHIALSISGALNDLSDKYKSLQPYLEQIDQIEESVTALEQAAYSLDQYSKRLENKFKAIEKR